jgi:hypothetical protein
MVKLQLDGNALERIIGGDTKVEIEVRTSIVAEFVKKYLKGIANETIVAQASRDAHLMASEAAKHAYAEIFDAKQYGKPITVAEAYKRAIELQVDKTFRKIANEAVEKAYDDFREGLDGAIDRRIASLTSAVVDEKIKERLKRIS